MFAAIQQWRQKSLANAFAIQASGIVLVCVLAISLVSLSLIYWMERQAENAELNRTIDLAAERLEHPVNIVETALSNLSLSSMFSTALLDSAGRSAYIRPFLLSYAFPISATTRVALCDINGDLVAGSKEFAGCDIATNVFQDLLTDGKTRRTLARASDGSWLLSIYTGVKAAYGGTIEGVAVAQIELADLLNQAKAELNLDFIQLYKLPLDQGDKFLTGSSPPDSGDSRSLPVFRGQGDFCLENSSG